jgi:glyoxylase-like metal-dependent hydrolase (beta-lactamase superfamily II)
VHLTERVSLIGSGEPGLATTDPNDCQVYLIRTAQGAVCIDAGSGGSVDAILHACRSDGVDPATIRWLFVTHAHADHAGGAAAWQERLPDVKVAMAYECADWIRRGDEEATSVDVARNAGMYPPEYRLRPARVDRELVDGERLDLDANLRLTVIATPGHSRGHLSFLVEDGGQPQIVRILFSGDALFPGGRILLQDTWDCDLRAALRSVEQLATMRADQLLAGHLAPLLSDADATIQLALGRISQLVPPLNLL